MANIIKTESIAEQVAEHLRRAVDTGALRAGEKITEQEICDELQVSRTPVREAFRILQVEGYLQYRPRYGVFVAEVSEQDIYDIWEVRIAVEEIVCKRTAERADNSLKAQMQRQLKLIEETLSSGQLSESRFRNLDEKYYELHVTGCGSKKLEELARSMRLSSALIRRKPKFSKERGEASLMEIARIYKAYLDNDVEAAVMYNREHFRESLEEIKRYL